LAIICGGSVSGPSLCNSLPTNPRQFNLSLGQFRGVPKMLCSGQVYDA